VIVRHLARTPARASLLAAAVASVAASVAGAAPATLHLNAVVEKPKSSSGATYTTKEELFEGTRRVGEDVSRCTETSSDSNLFHCVGSYTLTHGTIKFSGTVKSGNNRLSMTGGTGAYKSARGTVLTEYNKAGTRAKETLSFK
jgi:hypothetical protein